MKYFLLLLFATFCFTVNAQNNLDKAYLTKSFSGESINKVISETSGGNIIVTAVNPSDARVEVFVNQNNGWKKFVADEEIRKRLDDDYKIDVSMSGNTLTASAKPKHKISDWEKSLSISFKIYVPKNVEADLETSGGNIELAGLAGKKDFKTSGGNLVLSDIEGKTNGKTSGGNIRISNSRDEIDLKTSGGNIDAENSSGNISLSTSGGSIKIENLKGNIKVGTSGGNIEGDGIDGDLSAQTSGGNISLQGLHCSLKAGTSGGNIAVSMKSLGKFVAIHNSAGKVDLQIPKSIGVDLKLSGMKVSTGNLENFKGSFEKDEIKGSLNGGGIPVTVDARSGNINLAFN